MSRWIDADELLARIRLNYNNHQNITAGVMTDLINTTKTAYSVDKVVAELEGLKSNTGFGGTIQTMYADGKIDKAIDTVKRGGVE